jgi:IS5 family transposase
VSVTRVQKTFSELEYTGKKKQTRRDRFLADLEQLVPWAQMAAQVAPFYSDTTGKRGRCDWVVTHAAHVCRAAAFRFLR